MDRQTAEYYRKMAEYRDKTFKPSELSSIGKYYQDTSTDYYKQSLEKENELITLRDEWTKRVERARQALARGSRLFQLNEKKGPFIDTSSILDKEGNELDLQTIIKRQQWFSTSQGKMMPGKLGKVAQKLQTSEMDYSDATESYKKYKQLYDAELAGLEERNAKAKEEFLRQRQEILGNAQASAYRGATYTEKPL